MQSCMRMGKPILCTFRSTTFRELEQTAWVKPGNDAGSFPCFLPTVNVNVLRASYTSSTRKETEKQRQVTASLAGSEAHAQGVSVLAWSLDRQLYVQAIRTLLE